MLGVAGRDLEWGLEGPTSTDAMVSPFINLRAGQLLSADGSSLPVPVLSRGLVETAEYVPRSFAQARIDEAAAAFNLVRQNYRENIRQLKLSYEKTIADNQASMENFVSSVKSKALRHRDVQQKLRKQAEDSLQAQLKSQTDTNEDLRDKLADMNLHQQEYRKKTAEVKFQLAAVLSIHSRLKEKVRTAGVSFEEKHRGEFEREKEEQAAVTNQLKEQSDLAFRHLERKLQKLAREHESLQVSLFLSELISKVESSAATASYNATSVVPVTHSTLSTTTLTTATQTTAVWIASQTGDVVSAMAVASLSNQQQKQQKQQKMEMERQVLQNVLAALQQEAGNAESVESVTERKNVAKDAVKQWLLDFEEREGRKPNDKDKEAAEELFAAYRDATSALQTVKAAQDERLEKLEQVTRQLLELERLQEQFSPLPFRPTDTKVETASEGAPAVIVAEVLRPTAPSESAPDAPAPPTPAPTAAIPATVDTNALEDQIFDMQTALDASLEREKELAESKAFVSEQMNLLMAEKRTDVLKRLMDENELLRKHTAEMNETLAAFKATMSKAENKVNEYKSRAEQAEANVRSRDAAALALLPPDQEALRLRKELAKLTEELVNRSKAVTAGWDAAANAEERAEVELTKAYDKGFKEGSVRVSKDLEQINLSLEEKDIRIQELILKMGEMELTVKEAEAKIAEADKRAADAALEVSDALITLGASGGDGDAAGSGGVAEAEFDRVRAALDDAQEEIVSLQDRVDELTAQAAISEQTIAVYEQLKGLSDGKTSSSSLARRAAATPLTPSASAVATAASDNSGSRLTEALIEVKNALQKGTSLWKINTPQKKDEALGLYKTTAESCLKILSAPTLVQPLKEALDNVGKSLDANKWAPVLRKALEKLSNDGRVPANIRAEAALSGSGGGGGSGGGEDKQQEPSTPITKVSTPAVLPASASSGVVRELEVELRSLRAQLNARSKKDMEGEEQQQRLPDSMTGTILKRAQLAEKSVEMLRKQLQNMAREKAKVVAAAGNTDVLTAVELRRCQRRIKVLEDQVANGGSGGGGGEAHDRRAQVMADKQNSRKIKELENANKKEMKSLEARATKAESALKEARDLQQPLQEERDSLKARVKDLLLVGAEVEMLRDQVADLQLIAEEKELLAQDLAKVSQALVTESALRKKYKNELEDLKGAIRVYARCRPMARYENDRGCSTVVTFKDETSLSVTSSRGLKEFDFDAVYGPDSRQEQVFEDTRRLVESCIDGYNVCLFAYGQTGSGKTFTLTGSPELPGLTPRVIDEIFRLIELKSGNCVVSVRTYFLELYLDALVDLYYLLDNKAAGGKSGGGGKGSGPPPPDAPKLEIKMDEKKMVVVRGAVVKDVASPEELMTLFREGNKERHVGATLMNAESSRSHSIFSILIESYDKTTKKTLMGKISLVDLAGSERVDKTGATGERFKEGQAINKSLSALGNVISALSEGKKKNVPYRDNKLTMLMQDSLGGNAKTLMFVNFSPADYNADETVQSLNYAARVKKIVNSASKGVESAEVARLKAIIRKLGGDPGGGGGGGGADADADAGGEGGQEEGGDEDFAPREEEDV